MAKGLVGVLHIRMRYREIPDDAFQLNRVGGDIRGFGGPDGLAEIVGGALVLRAGGSILDLETAVKEFEEIRTLGEGVVRIREIGASDEVSAGTVIRSLDVMGDVEIQSIGGLVVDAARTTGNLEFIADTGSLYVARAQDGSSVLQVGGDLMLGAFH